ncbi:hypothetical protein FOM02_19230 [Bradyrhizobium sp. SEMIA]|nr:hypothetical protein FOM02_19230 [Bradyrhizobium sp. SEMIA]
MASAIYRPGPNPYDLLSVSFAACTAMTICVQTRRKKLPLKRVVVGVSFRHGAEGEIDSFERTLKLEGEFDLQQSSGIQKGCPFVPECLMWLSLVDRQWQHRNDVRPFN